MRKVFGTAYATFGRFIVFMHRSWPALALATLFGGALGVPIFIGLQMRARQQRASCFENIHRVGQALAMYIEDYDQSYPGQTVWESGLKAGANLQGCPAALPAAPLPYLRRSKLTGYAYSSYLSEQLMDGKSQRFIPKQVKDIYDPARTISICESAVGIPILAAPDPYQGVDVPQIEKAWKRHSNGSHYLFCDGHIKWLPATSVLTWDHEKGVNSEGIHFVLGNPKELIHH